MNQRMIVSATAVVVFSASLGWTAENRPPAQRIADRKPSFDGAKCDVELSRSGSAATQTMFYKPTSPQTGKMWDTWLYYHAGKYYLYYLANHGPAWDNISMATSPDGVHWTEHGRVLVKGAGTQWMGTGSTWKSPNYARDGRFFLNFSEWRGARQTIFFAESTDLLNWKRLDGKFEFKQDTRWYEENGRWDCIWTIPRPGGGLFGYWTATPKGETGGRFGFGESLDGVTWKALPPPKVAGVDKGEVGAVERIGDQYYMMFGCHPRMVTLIASRPEGPFRAVKKNLNLLSGHTYFSRFFPTPQAILVNHHSIARDHQVYFAPLKCAALDGDGTLRLGWWPANEKMKHQSIDVAFPAGNQAPVAMIEHTFDVERGVVIEATVVLPSANDSARRGFYVECGKSSGVAILLDARGAAELGPTGADLTSFKSEKVVNREMAFAQPARARLLLKHSLIEFYLQDILIECFSLPNVATGRIGVIRGSDTESIANLKAWR
jgi:hypothetical protein